MKIYMLVFSFLLFFTQSSIAQDGVRSSKKEATSTEIKKEEKISVTIERVSTKDSTKQIINTGKNIEKTSVSPKKETN